VLKILYLVQKQQRRGAEVFASQLSGQLRAEGCDVRIAFLYPYAGAAPLELGPGDVCLQGAEGHPSEKLLGFNPQLLRQVVRTIRAFGPDIVQANGSRTLKYGALAHRWARDRSWSLVYRNIAEPDRWLRGWRHALFYRRAVMPEVDGIVGVSDVTLRRVQSMYDVEVPMVRIPRAVDAHALEPTRTPAETRASMGVGADTPVVVFVGSLAVEKRPDRLLRVFGGIRRTLTDARLWIIGDGPRRDAVAAQIARDGLGGSVDLLGMQEHVADFLAAADLLLLTSDTEGTPGVVLEAAVVGTPVVATRVGGVEGCVVDGTTALLADVHDESALLAAAISVLDDDRVSSRLRAAARELALQDFSLDIVVHDYLRFYGEVLHGPRAPG